MSAKPSDVFTSPAPISLQLAGDFESSSSEFPAPIPLDDPRVPELPEGIFTHWLGDFIRATAESAEVPPELPAMFALGAISTAIQRRFSVCISSGYFEPTNLFLVCSMHSGNRKTESMKRAIAPLAEWEERQAGELLPIIERARSERKTIDARIQKLRSNAAKATAEDFEKLKSEIGEMEAALPDVPNIPQLFTQDVTPEHTGTMLAENGERLGIISDEGGLFDILGGRYSNGIPNLDVYLQSHACAFVRVSRGSRPSVNLKHPALTIAISPQPDVLAGLTAHKGFRGRGLLARFAYMLPSSKIGYRSGNTVPIPDHIKRSYHDAIMALADTESAMDGERKIPHVLKLSEPALASWKAFWSEVEAMMRPDGRLNHLKDWGGKLPGLVGRLAGVLHCAAFASCPTECLTIDFDTMQRAISFGRYLIEHALAAFNIMGADPAIDAARDLWRSIERRQQPEFTMREAWHPLRGTYKKISDCEPGFDVLIDHGYIREPLPPENDPNAPRRKGRPPSRRFVINPALMEGWL